MMKGVSPLRLFSRASPKKPAQDVAPATQPAAGTGGRAPLSSIPEAAFNHPVLGDANGGDFSSPPRKADLSTPRERKKSSALGQGGSYPYSENLDVSGTPPAPATSQGPSKSQFTWHQRQHSVNAQEAASEGQGLGSAYVQPASGKSVSRALKYNTHHSGSTSSGASGSGRPPTSLTVVARTPNVLKCLPAPSSTANNTDQQFDLDEDPTFWRDHNVQVLIRTRPLNNSEIATQGFARCVRQESAHMITWMGQPESRFTFDHVACESITQEKLFRVAGLPMVDNCIAGYNSCMFAYGQTGSGKTHTMLGDIDDLDNRPSSNRGMTPRVFEYLFARIRHEEEARRQERLKYHCKCSFLEIYNEQITDLLDPTSNNLQMREDAKKGVYVENLTEVEVLGVQDVIQLLLQGAANRKVAATNMNRESSRSHSVFTCVVESKWEYDSMMNTRYGRLNLVDLAGSERQKSSGAEGERLKEAANINKSLSTLGLVIMVLVDIANGKQRHVPYRDSKLTFLLQDSLGGNSKTTIIANVSPSSCCSNETLSTLKFAQRAKFIRNNAVVNEDASADVRALREQIQQLKDELSRLRRQGTSRSASFRSSIPLRDAQGLDEASLAIVGFNGAGDALRRSVDSSWDSTRHRALSTEKSKRVEALLAGSLRREQEAESTSKRLAAEIEQLNRLVRQREEDTQCTKMMLRFREDKIRRLEAVADGILSAEECLMEEKAALQEELQLLRARIDRNPELTRFAMENIRLMEDLRRYQEFYEGMEREILMQEIGTLRDQLIEVFEGKALDLTSLTPATPQKDSRAADVASMRIADEVMQLQLQLESYEAVVEEKDRQRKELEAKCSDLNELVGQLTDKLSKALEEKTLDHSATSSCIVGSSEAEQSKDNEAIVPTSMIARPLGETVRESRAPDIAASMRHAEEIMHLQLQLESYEAMLEEGQAQRNELQTKCSDLSEEVDQLSAKLKDVEEKLHDETPVIANTLQGQENRERTLPTDKSRVESLPKRESTSLASIPVLHSEEITQLELRVEGYEARLKEEGVQRKELEGRCTNLSEQVDKLTEELKSQLERERQMDITRGQAESETARTIKLLHSELMDFKNGTSSAGESPGAEKLRELMNELESRALYEAAAEVDDIIDETFSVRLSLDHNNLRGSYRAGDRNKNLELIQRKLQSAHALARETEAQFQTLSSSVLEMNISHGRERDGLMEEIRLSHERREELEAETSALASDLHNLRTALKAHEETVHGLERKWKREKDQLLLDVHEARLTAKEKGSEAATLLQRFEDSQSILVELEQTMNALVRANESKADSEKEWKREKDGLLSELHEAKFSASEKEFEAVDLQKKLDHTETCLKDLHLRIDALTSAYEGLKSDSESSHAEMQRVCVAEQQQCAVLQEKLDRTEKAKEDLDLQIVVLQESANELALMKEQATTVGSTMKNLELEMQKKSEQILGMEARLCQLDAVANEKTTQLNIMSSELEQSKSEVEELHNQNKSVQGKVATLETQLLSLKSLELSKGDCDNRWAEEKEALLAELQEVRLIAKERDTEASSLRGQLESRQSSLRELCVGKENMVRLQSDELLLLKAEIRELRLEKKALEDEFKDAQEVIGALNTELLNSTSLKQTRGDCEKEWGQERERLLSDLNESKLLADQHMLEAASNRKSLRELESAISEKENLINSLSGDLLQVNDEMQELRVLNKSTQDQLVEEQQLITVLKTELRVGASVEQTRSEAEKDWNQEKEGLLSDLHASKILAEEQMSEVAGIRRTVTELEATLSEKESLLNSLSEDLVELNAEVQELRMQNRSAQDQLEEKQQLITGLETELLDATSLEQIRSEIKKDWEQEKAGLLSQIHEATLLAKEKMSEAEGLRKTLRDLEASLSDKENLVNSLSEDLVQLNADMQELQVEKQSTQYQLEETQQLIATLEVELQDSTALHLSRSQTEEEWRREKEELLRDLEETKLMAKEKDSDVLNLRRQHEDDEVSLKDLQAAVAEKGNAISVLSLDLLESKAQAQELQRERQLLEDQLEEKTACIGASEARLLEVMALEETRSYAEDKWRTERQGLLSEIQQKQVMVDEKLSEAAVLRKTLTEYETGQIENEHLLGSISDELVHLRAAVQELQAEKLSILNQLEEKQRLIASLEAELLDASSLEQARSDSEQKWRREQDDLLGDLHEANLRLSEKEAEAENLQKTLRELEADVYGKENLLNSLSDELLHSEGEVHELHKKVQSFQEQVKEKEQLITAMQQELLATKSLEQSRSDSEKVWKTERDELLSNLQKAALMAKEKDSEAEALRKNCGETEASLRDLQSRMKDLISANEKLMCDAESWHAEREKFSLADEQYATMEAKLQRTEEVKQGLEFDISLLQESASKLKVKREEVEHLEQQLEIRCEELREMKFAMCKLEGVVYEKDNMLNSLSDELLEAKAEVETLRRRKESIEDELEAKQQSVGALEMELLDATSLEADASRSLKKELNCAIKERDRLHANLVVLTEQLEIAQSVAEEQESLASDARQVAEASKALAEEKDAEARLLERSVEELESTVNALESQVGIVKREGERQRLLREDLEMEVQSLRHHMSTVQASTEEKDMLLLQARRPSTLLVSSSKSVEKPKAKTSGSPFKCGSKGLVQQIHSDIDEEIYSNRQRIEELEGIAAARQKEVFMLHTRLAEAESMTHDVIRDLLGVKLDITNCASLLSQEKVQQIAEAARKRTDEAKEKDAELSSIRAQLTEFIEERESWLEEINRRQAEMVAARVAAEKLRLRDQTLTAENERLQRDSTSQRKRVLELEGEVKKLSGQQNLQQRIHHHAKIKEENNQLRTQNEDLSNRLRRTEAVLARVSDELARYRTVEGKTPFLNIDEEHRLKNRLKEEEDNRIQIAQKLISICTAVMKAAGIGSSSTEIDSDVAFRAVHQLEERLQAAERELSDMKLHSRIAGEKRRLSELRAVHSPYRTNFTAGIQVSSPRSDR